MFAIAVFFAGLGLTLKGIEGLVGKPRPDGKQTTQGAAVLRLVIGAVVLVIGTIWLIAWIRTLANG